MMHLFFGFFACFTTILLGSSAFAQVEFACGTKVGAGSFYSETGRLACADKIGDIQKDVDADNEEREIFCMYHATCTPITKEIRKVLTTVANGKDWSELSDHDVNQVLLGFIPLVAGNAIANGRPSPFEVHEHSVQCMGTKSRDGTPNCPSVNACVNNRKNASAFWKIKRYDPPLVITTADSIGYRARDQGPKLPKVQDTKR
jgi:hypothetical protein